MLGKEMMLVGAGGNGGGTLSIQTGENYRLVQEIWVYVNGELELELLSVWPSGTFHVEYRRGDAVRMQWSHNTSDPLNVQNLEVHSADNEAFVKDTSMDAYCTFDI